MPEIINVNKSEIAPHFISLALSNLEGGWEDFPLVPGQGLTVTLTVNGIEIPFMKTLTEIYNLCEQHSEKDIASRIASIHKDKLDKITEAVDSSRRMIVNAIEDAFGASVDK